MSAQIMAIINTSPDSFAGDGIAAADESALLSRLRVALDEGADILDIGGQSTRPGAEIISTEEEIARVLPAIKLARQLNRIIPISIDTFKPDVARAALEAGATMLNDITGFSDESMVRLAVEAEVDIVVMHMRGTPQTMSKLTDYPRGVVTEVTEYFEARTKALHAAGVASERIIIDPGIGFAKTAVQSFELTNRLAELKSLGFRVLYGASNKSFLGKALAYDGQIAPVEERAVATVAVQTSALLQGADIIRVHDVRAAVQTRIVVEAMLGKREVMS
jgi:dihydropteroate synthase